MNASKLRPFRAIGALTLVAGLGLLLLWCANLETRRAGGIDLGAAIWLGLAMSVLGIATTLLRRWAIILVSLWYGGLGIWLIVGSLILVPLPWSLLNIALGIAFLVPGWLCFRAIRQA